MLSYSATITINAPAEKIWQILTNAPGYPEWDPTVIRIEGTIAAGNKITAYTKLAPNRAFPVKVTEFVPGQHMVWASGMPLGLFKGARTFTLTPQADGSIEFSVREEFAGPMLALIRGSLPNMNQPFADFAAGLKAFAEKA